MRVTTILLLVSGLASGDEIHFRSGSITKNVKIVEKSETMVVFVGKSLKQQRYPMSLVKKVVQKPSIIHEYDDRATGAKSADSVMALADWAAKKKFHKKVIKSLHEKALKLDPTHEGANLALGRVQYEGEWMTPTERDTRAKGADEAAMKAKGLVRWQDEWVTPEDKAKLEKGLRKYKGRWMSEAAIKEAEGYVRHEGGWVKKDDLEIVKLTGWAAKATGLGKRLQLHQTEHYAVMGDLPPAETKTIAETMERLYAEWVRIFPSAKDSDLLEGKHRLYAFKKNGPYKKLVRRVYETQKRAERWSRPKTKQEKQRMNMRMRETSFWEIAPYPLSAHVQMPDPFEGLRAHCVHFGANSMSTRFDRMRFPTWWLNEGLAYYLEKRVTGTIQTFNVDVGRSGYADGGPLENNKANPWLDGTKWPALLTRLVQGQRDPKLDRFKAKTLYGDKNRLNSKELAKAWSVVTYLIETDVRKFAEFFIDAKSGPGDSDLEREVSAMLKHFGGYRKVDEAWRAYAKNNFRIVR